MNSFDNKEKAEENKYAHDKQVEFLINSRFHKLLALWVAAKAGFDEAKTLAYKQDFIASTMEKSDTDSLLAKVKHDFMVNDLHVTENDIREAMHNALQTAKNEIMENK